MQRIIDINRVSRQPFSLYLSGGGYWMAETLDADGPTRTRRVHYSAESAINELLALTEQKPTEAIASQQARAGYVD